MLTYNPIKAQEIVQFEFYSDMFCSCWDYKIRWNMPHIQVLRCKGIYFSISSWKLCQTVCKLKKYKRTNCILNYLLENQKNYILYRNTNLLSDRL